MNSFFRDSILPPSGKLKVQFSKPAIALILATVLLGGLLAFSTYQNIHREKTLMIGFLQKKAETIARSVEAGIRTSMMHHMGGGNPLTTLIEENSREKDILYIRISDTNGQSVAETGEKSQFFFGAAKLSELLANNTTMVRLHQQSGVYFYARPFQPVNHHSSMRSLMMKRMQWQPTSGLWNDLIITVGISTDEFELARRQDKRHTLMMAAILFLVGTAGLYFVFLYQSIRIARLTLTDMKLYTQNVIESMPAGLITLDRTNKIVSCNKRITQIFNWQMKDIIGKNLFEQWPANTFNIDAICLKGTEEPIVFQRNGQEDQRLKISGSGLQDYLGRRIGTVLIIRDVTDVHLLERQLERSRRMASLGKMAAGIAHEIRNPLGTLRGFAQYFRGQTGQTDEGVSFADLMVSEVDRLNHTVSSLLQFARPREPEMREIRLDKLFEKTHRLMEPDFLKKTIDFSSSLATDIQLTGDEDLLLQVLLNLLKNSISATPSNGRISLSCRQEENGNTVSITVEDNGKGMSREVRDRMFDPFFTTRKSGTGLGLAVSHQIIEQHNGSVEVRTAPAKGCKITVRLPRNNLKRT